MDLQIKNQQMKDKGICEDAELTEEMKLFLEQPIGVFLKQYFSWRGERKERSELGSITEVERKVITSTDLERYLSFAKCHHV